MMKHVFPKILDALEDMILICNADLTVEYMNAAFRRAAGIRNRKVEGRKLNDIISRHAMKEKIAFLLAEVVNKRKTVRLIGPAGQIGQVGLAGVPLMEGRGVSAIMIIGRRPHEDAVYDKIESASKAWRTTFDSITDFISIHDLKHRIIRMNRAFAELFGKTPQKLIGKTCHELLHGSQKSCEFCPQRKMLESGKPAVSEFYEPRLGMHLEISASPVFDEKGGITGCVHIAKDVSARKQAEMALKKAQEDLIQSEKMSAVGRFASGIAHEIRNPLGNIAASAEYCLSKKEETSEFIREYLNIILRNAQNANKIIRDLLVYVRPRTFTFKPADMGKLIARVRDSIKGRCSCQNIRMAVKIDKKLPTIQMDESLMEEAFLNFAGNALDAMPNGGTLSLTADFEPKSGEIFICFRDTGMGIPPENLDKIFEPFFTTKAEGGGLGLCMAHQAVMRHRGRIFISSKQGEFTEVRLHIPVSL